MPSWNIHTAHVESLLADHVPDEFGINDVNAFLFGNYVPDVYVGFMVPETTFHLDYCLTHHAGVNVIPVPDADDFWDDFVYRRRPSSPAGSSLTVGAWAHLLADRVYNARFREFCKTHDVPRNEERRIGKQADFALFGDSLSISSTVRVTSELLEAARDFCPYSVLPDDVTRSVDIATAIVRENGAKETGAVELGGSGSHGAYRLLSAEWMQTSFAECDALLKDWLGAWQSLEQRGLDASSENVRAELGIHAHR